MATEKSSAGLLVKELHRAIESASFERVPALSEAYGKSIIDAIRGAISPEDAIGIASEACSFLQDRLHLARVMRAHISAQMAGACQVASYRGSPAIESTWYVNG